MTVNAGTIQAALVGHLRSNTRSIVLGNVFVKGSPWESDVIAVTGARYWHEYEIKVTRADYQADFAKRTNRFSPNSRTKHDCYADENELTRRWGGCIPKPKSFTFVVPKGLLEGLDVPEHCGIIEYDKDNGYWGMEHVRAAPTLLKPTKLNPAQIFNLALKAAGRVVYGDRSKNGCP